MSTQMRQPEILLISADLPARFPGQCSGKNLLLVLLQCGKGC